MPLPKQKLAFSLKGKDWGKETVNYYETISYGSSSSIRNSNYVKRINYDLVNGKFNKADLEYVCNPLGLKDNDFPATLQHYDIISPAFNLLVGEESKRPDNCIVISESTNDINRKQQATKDKIFQSLQQTLMGEIDPSTIDPNNPPPTPEQILKYERHNLSDIIESQANKTLKYVKKSLNTKEVFKRGWKDALTVGEEIYWTGVTGSDLLFRRCNPLNITVVLDGDTDYIDDATAVVEIRLLAPNSILDEFGDDLTPTQISEIEDMSKRFSPMSNISTDPNFVINQSAGSIDIGSAGFYGNQSNGSLNSDLIRVVRVEWKSLKKLYNLEFTDETGELVKRVVDESFNSKIFKEAYPDAVVEEYWINEAWEGIKIGNDIFINIQPKENQRRRMDNPYYCKLGYTGLIYNAVNSTSVSLIDRVKPYQYLYNIISYRLELAFASDQGRVFLMDLAQIPQTEGMDLDRWLYYLKSMKIAFINSFEEGKKGGVIGKLSNFNQFQSIDLSLANQINQYIDTLDYIKQQIAFISGVSPQRLGAISTNELVGNVERSVQQSALITEYLFDAHEETRRRVYVALIECAKIAFRKGKKVQYVLDDMGIEILNIEEGQFDNSEFNVYVSNSQKDLSILESYKQLAQVAMQSDKADLSTLIDTLINDSPKEIVRTIQRGEAAKYARDKAAQDQQAQIQQGQIQAQQEAVQMQLEDKQKDRDLKQYEIDRNNETKIAVQEIANYFKAADTDVDADGIPDPIEIANQALAEQELASRNFLENSKLSQDRDKHNKEMSLKEKEMANKKELESRKIDAIKIQNKSQEKIANDSNKLKEKELANKLAVEKLKLQAARAKAAQAKKKK